MARSAWKVSKRGAYSIESRRRAPARRRLTRWGGGIEALEDRTLLATDVWTGADSSSWSDGGNWSLGASPGVSDVASFTNSGTGVSLFSATVDSASSISGLLIDGSWNGTLTFHAALSLSGASQLSGGTLDFSQGTSGPVTVPGSLANGGSLTISGSTLLQWDAADEISNSGTMTLSNGIAFVIAGGGTLSNTGTIDDQVSGNGFQIGLASTLDNQAGGTFNFLADATLGGAPTPGTFTNSGLLEKTLGSGSSSIGINFRNANGTITVNSGTISIASTGGSSTGGNFTVAAGATLDLTAGNTVTYSGSYNGSGAGAIALEGGTLAIGAGGATFNFTGPVFQWSQGTLDTSLGNLTNTGTMNLTGSSGDSVHLQGSGVVTNLGTIIQSGAATLDLDSPVMLNNQPSGIYNIASDAAISEDQAGGSFANSGILEKTAGTGTSSIDSGINFRGTGTVSVQSGTLSIGNTGAIITAGSLAGGTWIVAAGSTLSLAGDVTSLGATVDLEGQGAGFPALGSLATIATGGVLSITSGGSFTSAANLDNAGTLDLGPGTLTVAGNFTQESAGVFKEYVGGTTPGTGYGQLTVRSKATLAGSLLATVSAGFSPVLGQTLPIIPFGSLSGKFGTVSGLILSGPLSLSANYGTNSVALETIKSTNATLSSSANPAAGGASITFTVKEQPVPPQTGTPGGTVTFLDGTTTLGTATLSNGQATFSTSALPIGLHAISVSYGGDSNFVSSTSNSLNQEVQNATKTALVPSVNPSVYSQALSLTATVSSAALGAGTPTGNVTFMDGSTMLGSASLNNGTAVFNVPGNLATTAHTITAVYGGDTEFATSTSPALTQTVKQDGAITTVKSSNDPSVFGDSTTLSANVTLDNLGSATPTGTVTFKDGTGPLGTVALANGKASLSISNLPGGSDSITAVYNGDVNFSTSTSPAVSQTVNQQGTKTVLTSSGVPTVFGESATFNVTVSPDTPGSGTPSGTVTLSGSASLPSETVLGTFPLINGSASIPIKLMLTGMMQVFAGYNGDANFAASTSQVVGQTIGQDGTATVINTSGSPSGLGTPVILTATVSAQAPGSGTPSGEVTFMEGTTSLGSFALSGGSAQITTTFPGGSHTIFAVYGGDANFIASNSPSVTQTIAQVGSHTLLTSSAGSAVFGQAVRFTATVSPASGIGAPEGSVTFMDGSATLGTIPLSGGTAVFTTNSLPLGSETISARYGGGPSFTGSTSSSFSQTVIPVATLTTLSPSANPGFVGKAVAIMVTVNSAFPGIDTPGGSVTFKLGKKKLGTGMLINGTATLKTKRLALGSNKITVIYSGNADFQGSTSATLKEVIKKKPPVKKPKKK